MGTFSVRIQVGDPSGRSWQDIEALADTGATYTWIARDVLDRLGVTPEFRSEFETAGGRVIERDAAQTWVRIGGQYRITLVVFGDSASRALLGAYTLEGIQPVGRPGEPTTHTSQGTGNACGTRASNSAVSPDRSDRVSI